MILTLMNHARRYPESTPQDYVKLLYQSDFGGGHLLADRESAFARLQDEYSAVQSDYSTATPTTAVNADE